MFVCKLISNKHSCVLLSCERSWHTQPEFAMLGTVSEGWEFKVITIFWSVEVRDNFVLGVNGIVWQRQLANEALPHQRLCSLGVSSSRLTTNRNLRWYLGFPKQEAAKSSKRAIHFPVIMLLLLYLLGGYWSVFQRVAREVFHPHFSPDEKPSLPGVEPREGCFSVQNWLNGCDSGFDPFCSPRAALPPYDAPAPARHSPPSDPTKGFRSAFFRFLLWRGS